MLIYINGDEHTMAACATNNHITAEEDANQWNLGARPHPDNIRVSWGIKVSELIKTQAQIHAKVNKTNTDIIEHAMKWVKEHRIMAEHELFLIVGWNPLEKDETASQIFNFHLLLKEYGIKHIFFDTVTKTDVRYDYGIDYLPDAYCEYLTANGYEPVLTSDKYFGREAHSFWSHYILTHIVKNKLI